MDIKIIQDRDFLSAPCKTYKNVEEGSAIGKQLLEILSQIKSGAGLAANQIGLDKRVCVINVTKPLILINPRIIGKFKKISYTEACLSFPGDYVLTERYENIAVKADNHIDTLYFGADKNVLECVCVQHEIDHLNGVTMYDRQKGE